MSAAVTPPPAVGPDQWYYVKAEYRDTSWVVLSPWSYAANVSCFPDNPWPITAQSVQVQESWTGQRVSQGSITRNVNAFSAIGRLLSTTVLPAAAEAAIYWAAALIPSVTLIPQTADMTGRAGFGIALTDPAGLQNEWIFSKDTYTFLGTRATQATNASGFVATDGEAGNKVGTWFPGHEPGTWVVEPGTFVPGPKAGTLLAETAIVARGAANSLGGEPALFA